MNYIIAYSQELKYNVRNEYDNENPSDNYMVLSPNFVILEQQFDSYVKDINFPVLWYNKVTNLMGLYDYPYDEG